ncbi:DNA mismatch repair protein MutL [Choanephora cucurbitarum]|uniref:DNA mismatch repair protein MutL n=1 Tax=Choanephora cucurbitarum TaxID=101091 RepID=A0A1C7NM60_9FUNG|nr:DNA mismatch repair protein MutL [Choanephora cucurbitarum]
MRERVGSERIALDANASSIDVILDIERFSFQVNDNGCGIYELKKIGQRHVTSKCHTMSDLNQLKTFGFRGEALAAITNESMTQIISRHRSSKTTYEGFWRDGKIVGEISESIYTRKDHPGTTVIVRDLFYKLPVRRRQSANAYQNVATIESVRRLIINFAIYFHHVSFTLIDSNRNNTILSAKRSDTSLGIFRQFFGQEMTKMQEEDVSVSSYISTQGYPNKTHQFIYLNNYFVPATNELYKIVSDMFSSSQFSNVQRKECVSAKKGKTRLLQKFPIFFIKFTCPKWSSFEIFMYLEMLSEFSSYSCIESLLKQLVTQFLQHAGLRTSRDNTPRHSAEKHKKKKSSNTSSVYLAHTPSITSSASSMVSSRPLQQEMTSRKETNFVTWWDSDAQKLVYLDSGTGNTFSTLPNSHDEVCPNQIDRSHLKKTHVTQDSHEQGYNIPETHKHLFQSPALIVPTKLSKEDLQYIRVLGQVDKKYIAVILKNNSILMIDQHAADERIKLEGLLQADVSWQVSTLEPGISLQLDSLAEYQIITSERNLNCLKMWGIYVTNAANNSMVSRSRFFSDTGNSDGDIFKIFVTQIPNIILDRCISDHALLKEVICDHAYWMMEQRDEAVLSTTCPKGILEILKSKACRSAIMFNDSLSLEQCQALVDKLSKCNFPFQCAHGRPSVIPINLHNINSFIYHKPKRSINWNALTE